MVLGEIPDLDVVAQSQLSGVGDFSHDTFHEGGFSFPVASDECYFLAFLYREAGVLENDVTVIVLREFLGDDGIFTRIGGRREFQS